ncbi:MAG TPA: hypothetical protein VHS59_09250 [Bacillota bacterium]|nr:hypothetical protein [Bacillota bacterium]
MKGYAKTGIKLENLPFTLDMTLYPQYEAPRLRVTAADGGQQAGGGTINQGGMLEIAGYKITFDRTLPWTQLMTGYDPGARVVFSGIVLALAGQTLLVLSGRKEDNSAVKELEI